MNKPQSKPSQSPTFKKAPLIIAGVIALTAVIGGKIFYILNEDSSKPSSAIPKEKIKDINNEKTENEEYDSLEESIPEKDIIMLPTHLPSLPILPEKTLEQGLIEKGKDENQKEMIAYLLENQKEKVIQLEEACRKVHSGSFNRGNIYQSYEPGDIAYTWAILNKTLRRAEDGKFPQENDRSKALNAICGTEDIKREMLDMVKDDVRKTLYDPNYSMYEKYEQLKRITNVLNWAGADNIVNQGIVSEKELHEMNIDYAQLIGDDGFITSLHSNNEDWIRSREDFFKKMDIARGIKVK